MSTIDTLATTTPAAPTPTPTPAGDDLGAFDGSMTAVVRTRFGGLDELHVRRVEWPTIGPRQLLVRTRAVGLHHGDLLELHGWPYVGRLVGYGARRPKRRILGTDVAGTVVAVGADVADVDVDDEVVGWATGAFAEFAVVDADAVVRRPATVSAEAAASLPTTGVAALQAVRDAGRVGPGQHVLVLGASGGVGTIAVQVARALGAEVTAVVGPGHVDTIRALGVDHVVDRRFGDPVTNHRRYDVVVDLVGRRPLRHVRRAATAHGTVVVVGGGGARSVFGVRRFAAAVLRSTFTRQRLVPVFSTSERDDLASLVGLVERGAVTPVVSARHDLTDVAAALGRLDAGGSGGKIVLTA